MDLLFMKKENRDNYWKNMLQSSRATHKRNSSGPHLIHPQYIQDYEAEMKVKLTAEDKGFGNTLYQTYFAKLYGIKMRN